MKSMIRQRPSRKQRDKKGDEQPRKSVAKRRSLRLPILCGLLVILVVAVFFNGGAVGFFNAMARNAIASKRLDTADQWLEWAKTISAENSEAEFLRSRVARKKGELDQMASHLKSAFKFGHDKDTLQREQDLALASLGRLSDGVEERLKERLEKYEGESDEIIDAYANGLTAISRFEEALELLNMWETAAPQEPVANYRKARIHEHLYQYDTAEQEYRKALSKDPGFLKASFHLGRVLLQQRHPEESLKYFQACDAGASSLAARTGMAGCYRILGETEKARTILFEVLKSSHDELLASYRSMDEVPERFVAASDLGCIETELGEFAEAKKHLELALQKYPLDSISRYSYAVALRGLGMQSEAEENFEKHRAARAALDQVSTLQEAIRKDPHDSNARITIGKIILEHESERTGIFWIQSVFSYDPGNIEAHRLLAEHYADKVDRTENDKKLAAYHRSFLDKK